MAMFHVRHSKLETMNGQKLAIADNFEPARKSVTRTRHITVTFGSYAFASATAQRCRSCFVAMTGMHGPGAHRVLA
jgi:hypothetical protein